MKAFMTWIKLQLGNLLSGVDNKTGDPARFGMMLCFVVVTGTVIFYLVTGVHLVLREIAETFAIATAGGGAGAALTNSSQPKPPVNKDDAG